MSSILSYPGLIVSDSAHGEIEWQSPEKAMSPGGQWAYCHTTSPNTSQYLKCTAFDFSSVGDLDTIDGVIAEVYRQRYNAGIIADDVVSLCVAGSPAGDNKPIPGAWEASSTGWHLKSYGAVDDKWGVSLTPAIVKASTFGLVFSVGMDYNEYYAAQVDYVRMTVYYTSADKARITQDVVQPVVLGDTQVARITQDVVQPVVLGDYQKAMMTQVVVQVVYRGLTPPIGQSHVIVTSFID